MAKYVEFTVEGAGTFPFDMLRYDACYPRTGADSTKLEPTETDKRHLVLVSRFEPTRERWESFGWNVTDVVEYS